MSPKNLIGLVVVILGSLLLLSAVFLARQEEDTASVFVGGKTYRLEVAATPLLRERGLSGRESLCSACGMLFLFERPGAYAFWMKGMRFPLDIVWVTNGSISHIERRVPTDSREALVPDQEADFVLEFNAGAMDGVQIGDHVEWHR